MTMMVTLVVLERCEHAANDERPHLVEVLDRDHLTRPRGPGPCRPSGPPGLRRTEHVARGHGPGQPVMWGDQDWLWSNSIAVGEQPRLHVAGAGLHRLDVEARSRRDMGVTLVGGLVGGLPPKGRPVSGGQHLASGLEHRRGTGDPVTNSPRRGTTSSCVAGSGPASPRSARRGPGRAERARRCAWISTIRSISERASSASRRARAEAQHLLDVGGVEECPTRETLFIASKRRRSRLARSGARSTSKPSSAAVVRRRGRR